jgi:hypothetical protein
VCSTSARERCKGGGGGGRGGDGGCAAKPSWGEPGRAAQWCDAHRPQGAASKVGCDLMLWHTIY